MLINRQPVNLTKWYIISQILSFRNFNKDSFFPLQSSGKVCLIVILLCTDNFFRAMNQWHQFDFLLKLKIPMLPKIFLACIRIFTIDTGCPFLIFLTYLLAQTNVLFHSFSPVLLSVYFLMTLYPRTINKCIFHAFQIRVLLHNFLCPQIFQQIEV